MTLFQIHSLGIILNQEAENSQILVDRLYYLRKDSENTFWRALEEAEKTGGEMRLNAVKNWAEITETGSESIESTSIESTSWMGAEYDPVWVFSGFLLPDDCYGTRCDTQITPEIEDIFLESMMDFRRCIYLSGTDIQAAGTSIYLENPPAATLFQATGDDSLCLV